MTLRAGVAGWPIAHSLSPLIHGAWISAAGLDATYTAFQRGPGRNHLLQYEEYSWTGKFGVKFNF